MRATDRLAQFESRAQQSSVLGVLRDALHVVVQVWIVSSWVPTCMRLCEAQHTNYFHEDFAARLLFVPVLAFPVLLGLVVMGTPSRPVIVAILTYALFAVFAIVGLRLDFTPRNLAQFVERESYTFAAMAVACLVGYVVFLIWFVGRRLVPPAKASSA